MKKFQQLPRAARDAARIVKYTPCNPQEMMQLDDDLEDIAIVSNAAPESVKYGSGSLTANGPRVVPGIITTTADRLQQSAARSVSHTRIHTASPALYGTKSSENLKSGSRQSLLESIGNRFPIGAKRRSRDSTMAFVNKGHVGSELEISRKTRELRRKEIKREFEKCESSSASSSDRPTCNWSFVFDPAGRLCYYWSMVVSVAFLYNFWVMIYRFAFQEINRSTIGAWFLFDYLADLLYALDIAFHFRTGYLEEGVLQTDSVKLRQFYMNSTMFYIDCLCLLPLDVLYLSIGFNSVLRCFRLVKIYRFWAFLDRTERHTNYPNVFRALSLTHYVLVIFHWNACFYHIIATNGGFGSRDWFFPSEGNCKDTMCEYLHAFYWSTLALSTIGELPRPRTKGEYFFLILELTTGLFLFAAVLGHVANIVTNVSAARKEFQARLDAVKTYMRMRRVPEHLQNKVIRWFDYLWVTQKCSDEERSVGCLPDKLKAEIAIHVHLDTLKRVEIFQNTEAGFLCELVLRLRPVLFSPGDYICRKGEVGKEMYIVNRGRLQVVTDNGRTVLATLRAGSYFGEISVLNMGTAGNRRTASVRSLGYSDLFCLYKHDMWDVLKDYPAARVRLEAIAVKRLHKYEKEPLRKVAMGRCRSTPGLVESKGRIRLEDMDIGPAPYNVEPSSISAATLFDDMADNETHSSHHDTERRSTSSSNTNFGDAGGIPMEPISNISQKVSEMQKASQRRTSLGATLIGTNNNTQKRLLPPPPAKVLKPAPSYQSLYSLSTNTRPISPYQNTTDSPFIMDKNIVQFPFGRIPPEPSQEALLAEIKRLRERLVTLEADNASMSLKLSQQQWEVQNRLAEIELHICSTGSGQGPPGPTSNSSGSGDDFERNRESII
ncbi:cyclic nucleotide-gated channel rod photoreceptor subunit alpha-like [Uloborus diversus]|uniref:cyclic nucleotide-gated channel rod photoreceptor subunit alpha-like n=1 Tax=Uloborus diversus TaxID=327109 RepID=UPI0024099449|nr:cyclic nucleotide-gated channel rod photoreceptor subunit alpha-like [Uloborus diversus]